MFWFMSCFEPRCHQDRVDAVFWEPDLDEFIAIVPWPHAGQMKVEGAGWHRAISQLQMVQLITVRVFIWGERQGVPGFHALLIRSICGHLSTSYLLFKLFRINAHGWCVCVCVILLPHETRSRHKPHPQSGFVPDRFRRATTPGPTGDLTVLTKNWFSKRSSSALNTAVDLLELSSHPG